MYAYTPKIKIPINNYTKSLVKSKITKILLSNIETFTPKY